MVLRDCAINKLTEIERVDFSNGQSAADKINQDVSEATNGKINKFLSPSVLRDARFVLINAVYFKGLWTYPFSEKKTEVRPFYNEARDQPIGNASMMTGQAKLRFSKSIFSQQLSKMNKFAALL